MVLEEIYVFIRALLYIGVHKEPRINMYWNQDKKRGPIYIISAYIALNCYKDIKRYCYISNPEDDERLNRHLPTNAI